MKATFALSIVVLTMLLACSSITLPATPTTLPATPTTLPATPTTLPATPTTLVPVPEIILTEVLQNLEGCRRIAGVDAVDSTYSFSCSNSADTIYTVSMTRYDSEATAHTQFESSRGDNPVLCFHGYDRYDAVSKSSDNEPDRISHQQLYWQAGQWVVSIYANFDYGFFHFTPGDFAEAVYTSSIEHDLFQAGTCPVTGAASPLAGFSSRVGFAVE
jgi:hypothetical protein